MTNATATAPKFVIEDFAIEAEPNEYTDAVAALVEAGPGKSLSITADRGVKRDGTPGDGARARLAFQKAANDAGHTARVRKTVENEDGTVSFTFTLGKINGRAGKPRAVEADTETVEAAPAE